MEDIYENRVSYKHDGSETTEDNFSFMVSDGTNHMFMMQQDEGDTAPVFNSPQVHLKKHETFGKFCLFPFIALLILFSIFLHISYKI